MVIAEPRRTSAQAMPEGGRPWQEVPLWRDVTEAQWNDWKWQAAHVVRTLDDLKKILPLTEDEEGGVGGSAKDFKIGIPP